MPGGNRIGLDSVSVRWWAHCARTRLGPPSMRPLMSVSTGQESPRTHPPSRRGAERTIKLLQALAHDRHTASWILHWHRCPFAKITRRMLGLPDGVIACVFDLDGVLTTSATTHAAAWAETFDPFLLERAERSHRQFIPFDPLNDPFAGGRTFPT